MSTSKLPERVSLEYLKKLAKDRLRELRRAEPRAQLATVLLAVARDHGFSSWRALKAEIERRQRKTAARFFEACTADDVEGLRTLLASDPDLIRATRPDRFGGTGLHVAARHGHVDAVRLLLEHDADPNTRDAGDNASALHFAAGGGHVEIVRALLDAGGDVHGVGDVHEAEVIGWATTLGSSEDVRWEVLPLLIERGAHHHVFSAIAVGDLEPIRQLFEEDPEALDRRMSRFEQRQTALHFAVSRGRYDALDLLIELGADVEAEDARGQTPLAMAMLRGDREAMRRLDAAGARRPQRVDAPDLHTRMTKLAPSVGKGVPMISVPDIEATLEWYVSIGFREIARYEEDGLVNFGMVSFGKAELMFRIGDRPGPDALSLWLYTGAIEELYRLLESRQMEAARAALAATPGDDGIELVEDLYEPFYGGRQFSIRDLNGYTLVFLQHE